MVRRLFVVGMLSCGMALGQAAGSRAGADKATAFDVVSIRQDQSSSQGDMGKATADGYRVTDSSLALVLQTAYTPQTPGQAFYSQGQIRGLPEWAKAESYDIDARVSDEDRVAWQNPASRKAMLQAMLQAMLVDRCKLAVHREVKNSNVYSLVVGKDGVKFKESDPKVDPPHGAELPWGGVVVNAMDGRGQSMSMYGTSMASLASLLSNILSGMGQHEELVVDTTGLSGRYDFAIEFPPIEPRGAGGGTAAADDPSLLAFTAAKALGLRLEKTVGPVETLVIDHIDRPSAD